MTKPNSPALTPELMHPGQTSDALRVKLRQVGSRISDDQIAAAWRAAEKDRVTFSCSSIAVGALLLAKKEALGHGKWIPWCEKFGGKFGASITGKLDQGDPIWKEVGPRTLRRYTFLAERFLSDLEQGGFTGETPDHKPKLEGVQADEVLGLDLLKPARRKEVFGRIEQFVAGRSLQTMLTDFRRAENAADAEQAAHEAELAKKKAGKGGTAGKDKETKQLEFAEMLTPIGVIDTLFDTKSFVERTDKEFWKSTAAKLRTMADRAEKMAEEIK